MEKGVFSQEILSVKRNEVLKKNDLLAIEQPLQISLKYLINNTYETIPLVITMRTPGDDIALALGYLYSEGLIAEMDDVKSVLQKGEDEIEVELTGTTRRNLNELKRNSVSTGACGMCGKTSIDGIYLPKQKYNKPSIEISAETILGLSNKLRERQIIFQKTGGIHASAFFDVDGNFIDMAEDIGRHNSLDKLIGKHIFSSNTNFEELILLVSGRAGFELIQKAIVAGIPLMLSVGAPSSMSTQYAKEFDLTLCGFLKEDSFNIYSKNSKVTIKKQIEN